MVLMQCFSCALKEHGIIHRNVVGVAGIGMMFSCDREMSRRSGMR